MPMSYTEQRAAAKFKNYFAGLCDGEATFGINRNGTTYFGLKMRADEKPLMQNLQEELGIGRLQFVLDPGHKRGRNNNPCVTLSITSLEGCERLVQVLGEGQFMRSKKRKDYLIWKRAVRVRQRSNMKISTKRARIEELRTDLRLARQYDPRVSAADLEHVRA